VGTMGFFPEA